MTAPRERKKSIWQAIAAIKPTAVNPYHVDQNSSSNPWNDDGIKKLGGIGNINQQVSRRARTFTGQIMMSARSFPSRIRWKQKLLRIGVGLFLVVDVALIGLFLKSFF